MATILITGGTGMIGTALGDALKSRSHEVTVLTRNPRAVNDGRLRLAHWDPEKQTIDEAAVREADHIVHLAGANVGKGRWTPKRKQEIIDSRVKSGELIVRSLQAIPNQVKTVISLSAIGYYGPDPQLPNPKPFVEDDPPYHDFLARVVRKWEEAIRPATQLNKRLVIFRSGIVLSTAGGAYAEFRKPLRFGLATILGSGKQMVSWIHIDDLVRLIIQALEDTGFEGVYNSVSPRPASNRELILTMAKQKKWYLPFYVPAVVLKAVLGEMSIEVLKSATVSSKKIQQAGFVFHHPTILSAIQKLEAS